MTHVWAALAIIGAVLLALILNSYFGVSKILAPTAA
jgi:hypothetical protein